MSHRWLVLIGQKADDRATGPYRSGVDPRKVFVKALHPQLIESDLGQLRTKFAFFCRIHFEISRLNGRLIRKWICKIEHSTKSHCRSPDFSDADQQSGEKMMQPAALKKR